MWVLVMFDLPTRTPRARKEYAAFRRRILTAGFVQLQRSVYARHCGSDEIVATQAGRLQRALPAAGDVRLLSITDRQFARMRVFIGRESRAVEAAPGQLEMF